MRIFCFNIFASEVRLLSAYILHAILLMLYPDIVAPWCTLWPPFAPSETPPSFTCSLPSEVGYIDHTASSWVWPMRDPGRKLKGGKKIGEGISFSQPFPEQLRESGTLEQISQLQSGLPLGSDNYPSLCPFKLVTGLQYHPSHTCTKHLKFLMWVWHHFSIEELADTCG